MKKHKILVINPGSTSTKISVFNGDDEVYSKNILHRHEDLKKYGRVIEQEDFRYDSIIKSLDENGFDLSNFSIVMARGGILKPLKSGIYEIDKDMLKDLKDAVAGEHASNVAAFIAHRIKEEEGIPAYIVDPISVDEMLEEARVSGFKGIERKSQSHALNIRRVCFLSADRLEKPLNELNFIVAHLGGGISVAAVKGGRLIDVENANSLGPFSPERTGGLPYLDLIDLCYDGKYSRDELKRKLTSEGGVYSYLKTKDMKEVEDLVDKGDPEAKLILEAMVYQISKCIGEMAVVLDGDVDKILLTGGIAHSDFVCGEISKKTSFIAGTERFPGEAEMHALQEAGMRLIKGEEKARKY